MLRHLRSFSQDDQGAVTVDWVVLAASVILLCGLAVGTARDATFGLAENIATSVSETSVD